QMPLLLLAADLHNPAHSRALALAVVQASVLNSSRVKIAPGSSALKSVQVSPPGASLFRHVILRQVPRTEIEISFLCTSIISSCAILSPPLQSRIITSAKHLADAPKTFPQRQWILAV